MLHAGLWGGDLVSWKKLVKLELKFKEMPAQSVQASLAVVEQRSGKVEVHFVKKYLQHWFCLLQACSPSCREGRSLGS